MATTQQTIHVTLSVNAKPFLRGMRKIRRSLWRTILLNQLAHLFR